MKSIRLTSRPPSRIRKNTSGWLLLKNCKCYFFWRYIILKVQKRRRWAMAWISLFGISKLILSFPYSFYIHCTILSTLYIRFNVSISFFIVCTRMRLIKPFIVTDWSTLQRQVVTAENEGQHNLANVAYNKFQNHYSSSSPLKA